MTRPGTDPIICRECGEEIPRRPGPGRQKAVCDTCRPEVDRRSRAETWARHGAKYNAQRRKDGPS